MSSVQHMLAGGMPELGKGVMGAAAGLVGVPIALVTGAILCAAINVGILATRSDLRAREIGPLPEPDLVQRPEAPASRSAIGRT